MSETKVKKNEVKAITPEKTETLKRVFSSNRTIYHDLYKLLLGVMLKNMSWSDIPDYKEIEHCHFFHTFDSSGRQQTYCTPVGGHFHAIEITPSVSADPDSAPTVRCKSGPLKWVRKKNKLNGKFEKVCVPVNEVDTHQHDVMYLQSNQVNLRKVNDEAAKVIGKNANLTTKPAGLDLR